MPLFIHQPRLCVELYPFYSLPFACLFRLVAVSAADRKVNHRWLFSFVRLQHLLSTALFSRRLEA